MWKAAFFIACLAANARGAVSLHVTPEHITVPEGAMLLYFDNRDGVNLWGYTMKATTAGIRLRITSRLPFCPATEPTDPSANEKLLDEVEDLGFTSPGILGCTADAKPFGMVLGYQVEFIQFSYRITIL